jgi:predicted phosphoribosyltransferase
MKFIKPKTTKKSVAWNISENTLALLKYYSKYTRISEEEIVDEFLENLTVDKGFVNGL